MATSYKERLLNKTKKESITNDAVSSNTSYRQRLLNSANQNTQPTQNIAEKMDSLWVESTAPNKLQNINTTVKPVNISDFVKDIKNSEAGQRATLTMETDKLTKQIQAKEQEYNRANNISDWNKKNQTKTEIGQELNALKEKLDATKTSLAELNRPNEKLLTAEQVAENNKNAPLSQKIDKAIKYDIPKTAEKTGRTAMDLLGNVATGVTKGMEGYVDAAVGAGGTALSSLANLAGQKELSKNIKNKAEQIAGYGFAKDMQNLINEKSQQGAGIYNPSVFGLDVRDAAQEIARMYSVAATGGLPGLMISASGSNIEEALNEGESIGRATAYGAITGSLEGLVEKIFDPAKILGGGLKTFGRSFLSKIAEATIGEGAEEGITTALNPFVKMLVYEGDVENPFGSWDNFKNYLRDIGQSIYQGAVIGGLTLGVSAPGNVDLQNSFKDDVHKAVEKIQGINQTRKDEIANTIIEGATQAENIEGLPKNEAQNQAQNQETSATNTITPNQAKTAQNANMEQIAQKVNLPTKFEQEVDEALENSASKGNIIIGKTNNYIVNKVKQILGMDITNRNHVLSKDYIRHMKKHMNETSKNQIPLTVEDIKKVPDIINNPDDVIRGSDTLAADRKTTIPSIRYIKTDTQGRMYVVEAIPNKGNLQIKTMWKEPTELIHNTSVLHHTPEAVNSNLSTINNSISDNADNINISDIDNDVTTYISPVADIQSATKFVENATVNDIETLQKMVEEAEKKPDRIDLQFFAEKARAKLEKLSREQVESMLEEGINQNKISYGDSIYRNLRRALGEKGYKYVKENILDKLDSAKLDNVNMKIEIANELKSYVVDGLGIKKGSKESELVQKYGEKEITLDELKESTPNWENVVKADDWFRSKYDELIDRINESRAEIYPYIEEKIEATELELKVVKQQIKDIEENGTPNLKKDAEIRTQIENIQNRIDSKTKALEEAKNKNTLKYKNNLRIKNEAEQRLGELNDLLEIRTENKLYKLTEKAEKLQNILDSEELWRGKRIPKRKDYYRHFQEMTEGFEALGNILSTPSEISNNLSGISENTKPSSKWLGLAQRRLTNKTKYDAVGGFLNYLDSASYAINIDPEIKRIRDFTEEIRNASQDNTANRLIEYLTDYANDLAGKTNPMDRYIQKVIPGGRKTMKAISWVTNRIKSNAVLGNFNSAAAQILNIPQGLADIKNPKNIAIGFWETLIGDKDGKYKNSQFITERFNSDVYSQFNERLIDQPKKFATWLLGALDEFGTKTIWNGEYSKAVDIGIKDPARYADYRTRDLVAGRGIGELSLNQRSKTIGLLAPFTVEVSNYWGVVKDFISAKDFGGLVLLQVFAFLFNKGLEELGVSAGVFDLIDALIDAWNTEGGIDKKAGRVAGEFLSNTMFGQQIAGLYPENGADLGFYQLPTRSELFGDADPTRMGTGSVLSKAISNPVTSVVLPWGGTQLNKTTQGLSTFAKGGAYSKDAEGKEKLKYPVEQNLENLAKSALFGKWSTEGAKRYIESGFKALSANQTEGYEKAKKAGITDEQFYNAYNAQKKVEGLGDLTSLVKKNEIDKATRGLPQSKRKILYETFNIAKGEWDNSKVVSPYEIRTQREKLAREKLKTKKK